jgi:hypothetical protein
MLFSFIPPTIVSWSMTQPPEIVASVDLVAVRYRTFDTGYHAKCPRCDRQTSIKTSFAIVINKPFV